MIVPEIKTYEPCPECAGVVGLYREHWGRAYSARCSKCGWEDGIRNIEPTPSSALYHWEIKTAPSRTSIRDDVAFNYDTETQYTLG